jgi:hypothetical protein
VDEGNGVNVMESALFTLVAAEDESKIFAFGISITDKSQKEAVIYRRDPGSGQTMFGVHASAEAACLRYSMITPLEVVWQTVDPPPEGGRYCTVSWRR